MKVKQLILTREMHNEAAAEGISFTELLARKELDAGDRPSKTTSLDAFERQLQAHGIQISGREVSLVEQFYKTSSSKALFPEFINRNVRIGMEEGRNECMLEDLIATEQFVEALAYVGFNSSTDADEKGAFRVGQGAQFPATTVTIAEKSVTFAKIGHKFEASYEAIRRMSINLFAIHLQAIGRKLRKSKVAWALDTIVNGDGNSNPAPVFLQTTLNYNGLIDFDAEFEDFEPTVWVVTKAGITTILKLTEFKDPLAGFNYQATGKMISPLGVTLRKQSDVAASTLIGVDGESSLEVIYEKGASLVEVDKVIDKQFESAVISENVAFAKIYTAASRVWDYS